MKNTLQTSRLISRRTLLSLALLATTLASAGTMNVTGPAQRDAKVPGITSYVPANVAIGETVLINHTSDIQLAPISRIEFRAANNGRISAPLTRISSKLYRATVPFGAITGATTLINAAGDVREQPAISIVPMVARARGISLINMAQYHVGSVKKGSTEMLPAGTLIPQGEARFLTHSFSSEPSIDLDVRYVFTSGTTAPVPVLTERINCSMARPDLSTPAKLIAAKLRRELELEAFSAFDVLGAAGGQQSVWKVFQGRAFEASRERTVTLQGSDTRGTLTISETPVLNDASLPIPVHFDILLTMSPSNPDQITMSVYKRGTTECIGQRIRIPMPFDTFATDQIGYFNRTEDDREAWSTFGEQLRGAPTQEIDRKGLPLLVRRISR